MAREMGPVLKRCRSLGIEPAVLGIDKKSNRHSLRAGKKVSEYGMQLREKQKAKLPWLGVNPYRISRICCGISTIRPGTSGLSICSSAFI